MLRSRGIQDADLSPVPELVEIYLRLGRGPEAATIAGDFTRGADIKGQPWALARAARCRGQLAAEGEFDLTSKPRWPCTVGPQTPSRPPARTWPTVPACGGSADGSGPVTNFAPRWTLFDHLGAAPWSETARAELAATGETARRRDVTTLNDLTPQELQIALSLAGGRPTKETAAALFLSPKTIEYHLRSVYRKLSAGSRSELKAALDRLHGRITGPNRSTTAQPARPRPARRHWSPPAGSRPAGRSRRRWPRPDTRGRVAA